MKLPLLILALSLPACAINPSPIMEAMSAKTKVIHESRLAGLGRGAASEKGEAFDKAVFQAREDIHIMQNVSKELKNPNGTRTFRPLKSESEIHDVYCREVVYDSTELDNASGMYISYATVALLPLDESNRKRCMIGPKYLSKSSLNQQANYKADKIRSKKKAARASYSRQYSQKLAEAEAGARARELLKLDLVEFLKERCPDQMNPDGFNKLTFDGKIEFGLSLALTKAASEAKFEFGVSEEVENSFAAFVTYSLDYSDFPKHLEFVIKNLADSEEEAARYFNVKELKNLLKCNL